MQSLRSKKSEKGFTLVEIMIVVLIIGILLAIAIPNFVQARETSRKQACIANLKQIDSAKQQWAMDNKKAGTDLPVQADLEPTYVRKYPACPSGGVYTVNNVNANDMRPARHRRPCSALSLESHPSEADLH